MQQIEKRYPRLVNCLGRIIFTSKKCGECPAAFSCLQISKELRKRCFAPGKYRAGFGRKLPSKKTSMWGDRDDI